MEGLTAEEYWSEWLAENEHLDGNRSIHIDDAIKFAGAYANNTTTTKKLNMTGEELRETIIDYVIDTYSLNKDRGVVSNHVDEWLDCRQQVKSVDLDDVSGSLPELVRSKVVAEIEREYGKFSELEDERKDNFYLMLGIIDNALRQ